MGWSSWRKMHFSALETFAYPALHPGLSGWNKTTWQGYLDFGRSYVQHGTRNSANNSAYLRANTFPVFHPPAHQAGKNNTAHEWGDLQNALAKVYHRNIGVSSRVWKKTCVDDCMALAEFRRGTFHVPNLMQMSSNKEISSLTLDSAHE